MAESSVIKALCLDFVKVNCTYIASCPEDDYCIELVEA